LESYRAALLQALRRQRGYPLFARRLLQQGRLLLRLVLRSDGALASPPALVAPSSYPLLNAEALRMATAAAPFAPPPIGPGATLVVVVPVEFELRNTAPTIADASTP
jgi:TonB family protein